MKRKKNKGKPPASSAQASDLFNELARAGAAAMENLKANAISIESLTAASGSKCGLASPVIDALKMRIFADTALLTFIESNGDGPLTQEQSKELKVLVTDVHNAESMARGLARLYARIVSVKGK